MLKHFSSSKIICGCDEAGRGCLAGPVFAAAVILPKDYHNSNLDDSKKIKNPDQRENLRNDIEKNALFFAVARSSPKEIDRYNILNASLRTMYKAVKKLECTPNLLLIDGNRFIDNADIAHKTIIKGDGIYYSIAAASILAKTYRDRFMKKLAIKFPHYSWEQNKGYPTKQHREAILKYGPCQHHRMSFRLLPKE